jgi:hypothetical protein
MLGILNFLMMRPSIHRMADLSLPGGHWGISQCLAHAESTPEFSRFYRHDDENSSGCA